VAAQPNFAFVITFLSHLLRFAIFYVYREIVERQQEAVARAPHLPPPLPPMTFPTGFLSRLAPGSYSSSAKGTLGSPSKASAKTLAEENELALAFSLETLIQNRRWQAVLTRLASNPLEAEKDLQVQTRGGFMSQRGFTPLHYACERQPPVEVISHLVEAHPGAIVKRCIPGGCLPLHIACTWYGSADAVSALLSVDPSTAVATDELGNLAIHSACFSGSDEHVILALVKANPASVLTRNNQGSRPLDICKRLRHDNRRTVMSILNLAKEEILAKHRRSQSSGTWSEEAAAAAALNDRLEISDRGVGYRNVDDIHEMHGAMGVEVSYNDDENQEELLWV
jgi:Ankyrin repeats (3 copies)